MYMRPRAPIYVTVAGRAPRSPEDARYFAAWIDRMTETTVGLSGLEQRRRRRQACSKRLAQAKAVFVALQ